ncbi:hypothetical protein WAI453_001455 [Rhynchosporium graminicola]
MPSLACQNPLFILRTLKNLPSQIGTQQQQPCRNQIADVAKINHLAMSLSRHSRGELQQWRGRQHLLGGAPAHKYTVSHCLPKRRVQYDPKKDQP